MKTYKVNTIDELSKMNFILGKVEDLPSALKVELHKNALDNSDRILYRMFHNKYQVILPVDENELETAKVNALIFDVNKGESAVEDIDTIHNEVDPTKVAVVLDTYSAKDAISDFNKLKLYSKVNPTEEDWIKCTEKFSEILEGKDESAVTDEDMIKLKEAYDSIPDATVLNDELPEVPTVEPEAKVELETVTSTQSTEPEVPMSEESVQTVVSEVEPSVDPAAIAEKAQEVESQLDTNSDEPKEPEVPEEPKKVEPEIDLKAFMERLNRYEEKLDFILKKLGIDPDEVNSLVSYGQKMKALAKVDMGGELL